MADALEQLRADAEAKRARLAEQQVVTSAENHVAHTRVHELAEQSTKAYRRIAAARGQLTKARKDGSADKIAAARKHLDEVAREFERINEAGLEQMHALNRAALDRVGETFDLMRETWDASARVIDAIGRQRPAR